MVNVLKIVFLGVLGFALLVYLTAPEQNKNGIKKKTELSVLSIDTLPFNFELIGKGISTYRNDIFKKGEKSFIIVLNHDALGILNQLDNTSGDKVTLVANISKTPWIIKKLAVDGKLEDLFVNSKHPVINDSSGRFVKSLNLDDITQNKYFIYKVLEDGLISKVFEGSVKLDSLEKGISKEESAKVLEEVYKILK